MWVPLIENNEHNQPGADYFVKKHIDALLNQSPDIDTIVLGCTHYPLLANKIRLFLPKQITLLSQGEIVAHSLKDYLVRHPEIEQLCTRNGGVGFYTTDDVENFDTHASLFFGAAVNSSHLAL